MGSPTRLPRVHSWALAALVLVLLAPRGAGAVDIKPTSDLLVPYFEVVLDTECRTTVVGVANVSPRAVNVIATVHTNWGIPVLSVPYRIPANGVWRFDLGLWIRDGQLPARRMGAAQLQHVQAALSGRPSPADGLYYGTDRSSAGRILATGYVKVRTRSRPGPDALWGDYEVFCPLTSVLQGETLLDVDPRDPEDELCTAHGMRFLQPSGQLPDTQLLVWTPVRLEPSPTPEPPRRVSTRLLWFDDAGRLFRHDALELLPSDVLDYPEGSVEGEFGWVAVASASKSFVTGRYTLLGELSSSLHAWCMPQESLPDVPGVSLEKRVDGDDADQPPGPAVPVGEKLQWTFVVTNVGTQELTEMEVADGSGLVVSCPDTALAVGDAMTCTASSTAAACQQSNVATVTARGSDGSEVSASDPAHYFGDPGAAIAIETLAQGQQADVPPGPYVPAGSAVALGYEVSNVGDAALTGVTVTDSRGLAVSCPKAALGAGESMTCTASTTALAGQQQHVGAVVAEDPCAIEVGASDPAHYFGQASTVPAVDIEKYVNGQDADAPPGPTFPAGSALSWLYVVTNSGGVPLTNVAVSDDQGLAVSCPKTALSVGEVMHCSAASVAEPGPHQNVATVTAWPPAGGAVSDQDPCHYVGTEAGQAAIGLDKRVNGEDADVPTGPIVLAGSTLLWSFVVTNTGAVELSSVTLTDEGAAVACPKTVLAAGESMTCSATGVAARGQHTNIATVTGTPPVGAPVSATDPASYLGVIVGIDLEKLVENQDADDPPGVPVDLCSVVHWTYIVANTGDVQLTAVQVVDDQAFGGQATASVALPSEPCCPPPVPFVLTCPETVLDPGESMTCTAQSSADEHGVFHNVATATGSSPFGPVSDVDGAWYHVPSGCSPGYWKNHEAAWPAPYAPWQRVDSVFAAAQTEFPTLGDDTLATALAYSGGSGASGAAKTLLRHAVAAVLNAAHPEVAYPLTATAVIQSVDAALAATRDQMLALAEALDDANNQGCPLD